MSDTDLGGEMTARDLYGLVVRIAGLVFLVLAFFDASHWAIKQLGLPMPSPYAAGTDAVAAGCFLAIGLLLTFGAGLLTQLAYGRPKQ
jgi:hypothetical protein